MSFVDRIAADALVLLIPFFSAFVGWFTNVVAVRMMFHPTEFIGIPPFLGWQGIIPQNARRLAEMSTQLILTKLLTLEELFAPFRGEAFAKDLEPVTAQVTDEILDEVATKRAPQLWANAGEVMQGKVRETLEKEVREVAIRIVDDFGANITDILDLEKVVVEAVMEDRRLMSVMFRQIGSEEFLFIERSGIWFGFLFGVVQMAIWIYFPADYVLPAAGFFVGYATNWVALKLIFHPKEPVNVLGVRVQGLFHRRQMEVAAEFSRLTAGKVLNADNITKTITTGATAVHIERIVRQHVGDLIARYEVHPMAAMLVPTDQREALREELLGRVVSQLPAEGGLLHTFADKAVDIQTEIDERMKKLPPDEFEGVLRPAFQQDEWKLILAGAALGLVAGIAQLVYIFS